MKKIVTIAIRHPEQANLFLHGLRRDNHKWALAGGHAKLGEAANEAAARELEEETGLKGAKLEKLHENTYGNANVHLFATDYPQGFIPDAKNDPDGEFVTFKFLDPTSHENLHIPKERNILSEWMNHSQKNPEPMTKSLTFDQESEIIKENKDKPAAQVSHKFKPAKWTHPNGHPRCIVCGDEERTGGICSAISKASPKIKVEPFIADPESFNPKKHDFIVNAFSKGKKIGMLAVTHTAQGLMPFNFEVNRLHRRKGVGTAMATHAQKISGKKITRSPDMTNDAVGWANKFIKTPLAKAEPLQPQDVTLSYPVTIGDRSVGEDGKPFFILIKNFGPVQELQHADLNEIIDQHQLAVPIDSSKMMFVMHTLADVAGEKHVIAVHGMPQRIEHLQAAMSSIGPQSSTSEPYIAIDEGTYHRLVHLGPAVTSDDLGIKIHPAELKQGDVVLRTY